MPLEATGRDVVERAMSAGFAFPMRDGARDVTVVVTHEALKVFDPASPDAQQVFATQRNRIEQVAREKYERGDVALNGRIVISQRDLND